MNPWNKSVRPHIADEFFSNGYTFGLWVKVLATGHLPPSLTLTNLLQAAEHLDWQAQHLYLNLENSNHPR